MTEQIAIQAKPEKDFKPLNIAQMVLAGQHIIEASAGTGKTFNITRIFIRLLLVKELPVQKVLIVTFTKAATEELRGRIAKEVNKLKDSLNASLSDIDDDIILLIKQVSLDDPKVDIHSPQGFEQQVQKAKLLLKVAALDLDDASIFTIHGFCQRVIKQSAFLRQQSFSPDIVSSSRAYVLQEVQDWFRRNRADENKLSCLAYLGVATPDKFLEAYKNAFFGFTPLSCMALTSDIEVLTKDQLRQRFDELTQIDEQTEAAFLSAPAYIAVSQLLVTRASHVYSFLSEAKRPFFDQLLKWFCAPSSPKLAPTNFDKLFIAKEMTKMVEGVANTDELNEQLQQFKTLYVARFKAQKAASDTKKKLIENYKSVKAAQTHQLIFDIINEIKAKVAALKRKHEVIDHDDTIHDLAKSIADGNQDLIDYIRSEYPYALIDEFQDTDMHQYSIFSTTYPPGHPSLMLLMIGDPKQAIYGFRGGNINTYILARELADERWTMQHNYRSSQLMIDAYNVLFYGAIATGNTLADIKRRLPFRHQDRRTAAVEVDEAERITDAFLFDPKIPYPWIYAGSDAQHSFSDSVGGSIHFQLNTCLYPKPPNARKGYKKEQAQAVANEIVRLHQQALIDKKPVAFKDIAVLVSSANQANLVQLALQKVGVPSVYLSEKSDIFASDEAIALFFALDGILHSNQNHKFFRAISTDLFGLSVLQLMQIQHDIALFDQYKELIYKLKQIWAQDGILVMITTLVKGHFASRNSDTTKERILTNYMHLAELLNTQSKASEHAHQLLNWLKKQLPQNDAAGDEDSDRENAQRLESDEELVKVVTLHGSKGLEYPIVFIPFAGFKPYKPPSDKLVRYYCPERKEILLQIGATEDVSALEQAQNRAEQIRVLYVGITRAIYRCYLGIGAQSEFDGSALVSLLAKQGVSNPLDGIAAMAASQSDLFALRTVTLASLSAGEFNTVNTPKNGIALCTSQFSGSTGQAWQVESFSRISRQQSHVDLNEKDRDEEAFVHAPIKLVTMPESGELSRPFNAPENTSLDAANDYRFRIERSADTGNLLHNILEDHTFDEPLVLTAQNPHIGFYCHANRTCEIDALSHWLNEVLHTPITAINGNSAFTLASLGRQHTLKEPEFYFPLEEVSAQSLQALLRAHRNEGAGDKGVFAPTFNLPNLTGMMHGFIDLLFMHEGKYYVADYKSNFLGDSPLDYQQQRMQAAIESHTYDLQYLIYCWALDKYLQARLTDYKRKTHFGGVYYLFLRGMSAQFSPSSGVYSVHISDAIWQLLDNMFTCQVPEGVAP